MEERPGFRLTRRGAYVSHDWSAATRGVRIHEGAEPSVRLEGWLAALPEGSALTHLSAAGHRGWWLPPLPELPLVVAVPHHARVRRPGLKVIRRRTLSVSEVLDGVRMESPLDTLAACARDLSPLDLLCVVESARASGDLDADVFASVETRWGATALAGAMIRSRPGSESLYEVLLREFHRAVDVRVRAQHEVRDASGLFVARGDLWLVGTRTLLEYDGAQHRQQDTLAADLRRERRLVREGWTRRGYTSEDLLRRPVDVLRDIDQAVGRTHDPARVRPWLESLRASCFTAEGRSRLAARVRPSVGSRGR